LARFGLLRFTGFIIKRPFEFESSQVRIRAF
jgi:hypothetical protein